MILGLTGRMGAGKDTVYQRLSVLYPRVVQVSYARKLKESVAALFDISLDNIEKMKNDTDCKVFLYTWDDGPVFMADQTFREFLQRYGTEAHRNVFGQNFWLDAALPMGGNYAYDTIYVVTDVRFENEVNRVIALGGSIVKVIGLLDGTPHTHASENVPQRYDYLIDNVVRDDNFEALDEQLVALIEKISPSMKGDKL